MPSALAVLDSRTGTQATVYLLSSLLRSAAVVLRRVGKDPVTVLDIQSNLSTFGVLSRSFGIPKSAQNVAGILTKGPPDAAGLVTMLGASYAPAEITGWILGKFGRTAGSTRASTAATAIAFWCSIISMVKNIIGAYAQLAKAGDSTRPAARRAAAKQRALGHLKGAIVAFADVVVTGNALPRPSEAACRIRDPLLFGGNIKPPELFVLACGLLSSMHIFQGAVQSVVNPSEK